MKKQYTDEHARAGLAAPLPPLEVFPNQFPGYEIEIVIPSSPRSVLRPGCWTSKLTIRYVPASTAWN
jgi:7-cyano-7-deazaguanine reductase